jgi:hypothetical protein
MSLKRISEREDVFARHYRYDDEAVLAVDLGVDGAASVDVLDDVAIVVVDGDEESGQLEFDLPDSGAEVFITNGVLSIEVEQ